MYSILETGPEATKRQVVVTQKTKGTQKIAQQPNCPLPLSPVLRSFEGLLSPSPPSYKQLVGFAYREMESQ